MRLEEILRRRELLDESQIAKCRNGSRNPTALFQNAIREGYLDEECALRALAEETGMEFIDLTEVEVDPKLLKSFPQRIVHKNLLLPVRQEGQTVYVATADPFDLYPLDEASAATGLQVIPILAVRSEIAKVIRRHLGVGSDTIDSLMEQAAKEEGVELLSEIESDGSELAAEAQEASVIKLVNEILLEAIDARASDVHVESQAAGIAIRYRIDGMLHAQPTPPEIHRFQAAIISRLKIMARLNIAEKRLPQDGRMKLKVKGREIDVRVSVIPMIHGESLVMRILDKGALEFDLKKLGMAPDLFNAFEQLINLPHGIVLVTGPTGSGKTTTLYSALKEINNEDVKIITTEDPVEYQLEGINQIQVHPRIGLTFAASLRSILRHDPDVVLVGEIRDLETAENAIQASLTGHLVFSTLHTNDAAGAYTRMIDMGVEPFLVGSTVEAVMAQRLLRRLCPSCKAPYTPKREELAADFPWPEDGSAPTLYKPVGCRVCRNVGYKGRMGIYELLITTDEMREMVHNRVSTYEIKRMGLKNGMRTLRMDGWARVLNGTSSVDEVMRITKSDLGIRTAAT